MLRSELGWRHPPVAAVRPDLVAVGPPAYYLNTRMLIAELTVEAFDVVILRGLARLVEDAAHALDLGPAHEGATRELGPQVDSRGTTLDRLTYYCPTSKPSNYSYRIQK